MNIPEDAIIPVAKLTRYLLVSRNKNDKSKFLSRAGFTIANPGDLERALRRLIRKVPAIQGRISEYGEFYQVDGDLEGSTGVSVRITLFWLKGRIDGKFRFITLVPRR